MGQARERALRASESITVDFRAPVLTLREADKGNTANAVRMTIGACIQAAFPQGIDRREGKSWAIWQDAFTEEEDAIEVTRGDVTWVRTHLAKDDLKVPAGIVSWRESVLEYLDALLEETEHQAPDPPAGAAPKS